MRKAYNIVITVFLLLVMAAVVILSRRDLSMMLYMAKQSELYMLADFYGSNLLINSYLLGIPLTSIILVVRIVLTIRGDKEESTKYNSAEVIGGKLGILLEEQRAVMKKRLESTHDKDYKSNYWIGGLLIVLFFLAYWSRSDDGAYTFRPMVGLMACLFWGEVVAVGLWLLMRRFRNLDRIIKAYAKDIQKTFGDASAWEAFANDVLEAGEEWKFRDEVKDKFGWGIVGSRYFVHFLDSGMAVVVDSAKISKIATARMSYSTGRGMTRETILIYQVKFYYEKEKRKNHVDKTFQFRDDGNRKTFLNLLRMRLGEQTVIVQE